MTVSPPSIVFLNRFYWPDVAATGQMLTDLAEDLAAAGWEVTVITSRIGYTGAGAELPREEVRAGVRILRVSSTGFGRDRLPGRLVDSASYLVGAGVRLLRGPRPDMVVAMSDPPFLLLPALVGARLRRASLVHWVQDVFPDIAVKLGVLPEHGILARAAGALARALLRRCDAVVALGPRMTRVLVGAGARPDRTAHVHNWADTRTIRPVAPDENPFLDRHGLRDRFVVLYSGNAGRAHTFDAVLEAARRLQDDPVVRFVFIGGGRKLPAIRSRADREKLSNVRFLDYVPRAQLTWTLSAASVSLVTEDPAAAGLLVPSKTYGILASGRPLIFVGSSESDVAGIVREHGCGVIVSPDDPDALVAAIRRLRDDPDEAAAMGARGRRAAESSHDRRAATRRWIETVERLLARGSGFAAPATRTLLSRE